jgi:hypothetical protein
MHPLTDLRATSHIAVADWEKLPVLDDEAAGSRSPSRGEFKT